MTYALTIITLSSTQPDTTRVEACLMRALVDANTHTAALRPIPTTSTIRNGACSLPSNRLPRIQSRAKHLPSSKPRTPTRAPPSCPWLSATRPMNLASLFPKCRRTPAASQMRATRIRCRSEMLRCAHSSTLGLMRGASPVPLLRPLNAHWPARKVCMDYEDVR